MRLTLTAWPVIMITLVGLLDSASKTLGATQTVIFKSNSFTPSSLTVNVGDTVIFKNQGGSHTVTGTGTDPFCGNGAIPTSCSVTFNTPGTFPYRCVFHSSGGANPAGMIGSVTVVAAAPADKPNLVPFHLNGWTAPLVVSRASGNNISDPDFADDQDIWVDWAIANISLTTGITATFFTELVIDGVSKASWSHDGLAPDTFNKIEDFNAGKLPVGTHVFKLVTDHTSVVDESNEADNTFQTDVRVIPSFANQHTVLVSDFRFNPASLTVKKGDIVNFQNIEGTHTATGTGADPFCGDNAIPTACRVTFSTAGLFPYRCLFHSSGGANPTGMIGQIRVLDAVVAERAAKVEGPYIAATDAVVNYPNQTVTLPLPSAATFWRLNSTTALKITQVEVKAATVVLTFQ